jgi:3-phenylpropionate/trans-cinnamate dioxygenase ferredoxin reductase component
MPDAGVVIVGAGQAGFQTAASLRAGGYALPITLIGDEPYLPYQRPPLSKEFLLGKHAIEKVDFRPAAFYETQNIHLMLGERVTAIDRASQSVVLVSGASIPYDKLVLATGARVRRLPIDGALYLRDRDDACAIKERLDSSASVTIVGGGFIGLEVAAAASTMGKRVAVVEAQSRLMGRVVAPVISDFYRELHESHGVKIQFGQETIPSADLTIVGIGVLPNDELLRDLGKTDVFLRMSDTNIYAIGDCAEHRGVRLESVQNAVDQAKYVARHIMGVETSPYSAVPWFWTHQYDVMLQMAGLSSGHDRMETRGDVAARKFSVYYFRNDKLHAVDSINSPGDHIRARKELAELDESTPSRSRLPDGREH